MNEITPRFRLSLMVLVVLGISTCAALVGYGANANRIQSLEYTSNLMLQENRQRDTELSEHEKQIAVAQSQYSEILRRLTNIERHLEGDR